MLIPYPSPSQTPKKRNNLIFNNDKNGSPSHNIKRLIYTPHYPIPSSTINTDNNNDNYIDTITIKNNKNSLNSPIKYNNKYQYYYNNHSSPTLIGNTIVKNLFLYIVALNSCFLYKKIF